MSGHALEEHETAALFDSAKAGGEYLDSLNLYDLRYLDKPKLLMFASIIIAEYASARIKHTPERTNMDDEIPF